METRNAAISAHIYKYLHATGISRETYAANVVEIYHQRTTAIHRAIRFHVGGDAYKDTRQNAQIIRRYLDGDTKMPCEIEESLVMALPVDWQKGALAILAGRYGLLAAPIPNHNGKSDVEHLGTLTKEFGEMLEAIAPALVTNNGFGPEDQHLAAKILSESDDVVAEIISIRRKVIDEVNRKKLKVV